MNKLLVSAISLCLLAGCTMPPQSEATTKTAKANANCAPATGSHIVNESDCGGYASGAVKKAQIQNPQSGQGVMGGNH